MRPSRATEQKQLVRSLSTTFKHAANPVGFFSLLVLLMGIVIMPRQASADRQGNAPQEDKINSPARLPGEHSSKAGESTLDPANAGTLDIAALIREVETNGAAMHKQIREYTYSLKKTRRVLNEQGRPEAVQVQSFEAYPVSGEHVLIQLTSNGEPLPSWQIEADRRHAGKRLEKYEQEERQSEEGKKQRTEGYVGAGVYGRAQGKPVALSIDLSAFLHSSEFYSPQFERVGNRDMIVLSFRPRPGVSLPRNKSFVSKLVGSVWIDSVDKVVARLECWPAPEFIKKDEAKNPSRAEARLIYQQMKLPGGPWFPNLIRVNSAGDISLFDGLNWDVMFEFSDYRRFNATVEEVKIQDPSKQR
ncbi:MAG TPA: hypothetical protein VF762_12565 [Blastocatellia bacterium]